MKTNTLNKPHEDKPSLFSEQLFANLLDILEEQVDIAECQEDKFHFSQLIMKMELNLLIHNLLPKHPITISKKH